MQSSPDHGIQVESTLLVRAQQLRQHLGWVAGAQINGVVDGPLLARVLLQATAAAAAAAAVRIQEQSFCFYFFLLEERRKKKSSVL